RDPGLGRDAPQGRQHRVRRDDLVLGVVVLELFQELAVARRSLWSRHGLIGSPNDCSVSYRTIVRLSTRGIMYVTNARPATGASAPRLVARGNDCPVEAGKRYGSHGEGVGTLMNDCCRFRRSPEVEFSLDETDGH